MIPRFSPRVLFSCDPKGGYVSWDDHKAALAARDAVIRELVGWGDYDLAVIEASGSDWNAMRTKALALINDTPAKQG